jgi:hypothetical protein
LKQPKVEETPPAVTPEIEIDETIPPVLVDELIDIQPENEIKE